MSVNETGESSMQIDGTPNGNMPIDITDDSVVENICGMVEVLMDDNVDKAMKPMFATAIVHFIMMQHRYIKDPNSLLDDMSNNADEDSQ